MLMTGRIRQILEGRGCTVDISCEPWIDDGFVSFHKTGYPARKAIVRVFERIYGVYSAADRALLGRLEESIRELECQEATATQAESTPRLSRDE